MPGHTKRRCPKDCSHKRGQHPWAVVVDLGRDIVTGKRRQLWRSVKGSQRDADALLVKLLHERDAGVDIAPDKITVGEYLTRWLEDYARPKTAPKTFRSYSDAVRQRLIPALGTIPLTKLRSQHIQAFYSKMLSEGLAPRTVLKYREVLNQALRRAVKSEPPLILRNPVDATEAPRAERPDMRVLLPEEVRHLLATADGTQHGCLIHLAVSSGMRMGELLGLRWHDVDLTAASAHVQQTCQWLPGVGFVFHQPKTASSRRLVALTPESVRRLRLHRQQQIEHRLILGSAYQDKDLIFTTAIGTPIEPSNLRRVWLRILQDSDLGHLRFHDLRHAHASLMLQQGVHPKIVSERLGHSGVGITLNIYSHVMPGLQQEAAAQFDRLLANG